MATSKAEKLIAEYHQLFAKLHPDRPLPEMKISHNGDIEMYVRQSRRSTWWGTANPQWFEMWMLGALKKQCRKRTRLMTPGTTRSAGKKSARISSG